jgi:hypothetical protein
MTAHPVPPEDSGMRGLFEGTRERPAHTSAAAETGFILGLCALASAPFSITFALSLGAATVGIVLGLVGLATTSRPEVAGKALVPLGLVSCFVALVLVTLQYAGVDTAFGDGLLPTLGDWLGRLNGLLPRA